MRAVAGALAVLLTILAAGSGAGAATECFPAAGSIDRDAETIQLQAAAMGWRVGDEVALTAATILVVLIELSDQSSWEVCLRPNNGLEIAFRARGDSSEPIWLPLPAERSARRRIVRT